MRQLSTVGIFLGAATLMLSACGKGGGANDCDKYLNNSNLNANNSNYSSDFGYSGNDPRNQNQNLNSNIPAKCLPSVRTTSNRIPTTFDRNYDPSKMLVQSLQAYWGNIVVRRDVTIADTGTASIDVVRAGSYTWAQIQERLKQVAAMCPACVVNDVNGRSTSGLSIFGRLNFDLFSAELAFARMEEADVQFTNWNYYYFGSPSLTRMSHVISTLLSGYQQSWGYTWNQWCYCNYWNTGYYAPYYNYIPNGTSVGLSVGYSSGSGLSFGVGLSYNSGW